MVWHIKNHRPTDRQSKRCVVRTASDLAVRGGRLTESGGPARWHKGCRRTGAGEALSPFLGFLVGERLFRQVGRCGYFKGGWGSLVISEWELPAWTRGPCGQGPRKTQTNRGCVRVRVHGCAGVDRCTCMHGCVGVDRCVCVHRCASMHSVSVQVCKYAQVCVCRCGQVCACVWTCRCGQVCASIHTQGQDVPSGTGPRGPGRWST